MTFTLRDTVIDPTSRVEINQLHGDAADQDSRIFPFKRMEGRQAFDTVSNRLAFNHAYGPGTDTAFWVNFDWAKSLQAGMDHVGEGFSGNFGFVDTYMYWPIAHMAAPARDAVDCAECHSPGGRMANIAGIYVPGSGLGMGGKLGLLVFMIGALGVLGHALLRVFGAAQARRGGTWLNVWSRYIRVSTASGSGCRCSRS